MSKPSRPQRPQPKDLPGLYKNGGKIMDFDENTKYKNSKKKTSTQLCSQKNSRPSTNLPSKGAQVLLKSTFQKDSRPSTNLPSKGAKS